MYEGRHATRAEYKVIADKPGLIGNQINTLNGSGGSVFWRPMLMTAMPDGNIVVLLEHAIASSTLAGESSAPSSAGNARAVRLFGTQLLSIRVDLDC